MAGARRQQTIRLVVDTREQLPYEFSDVPAIIVSRYALPAGDYSLAGRENEVAVERKSLNDFVHTIIHERDRFRRELEKLQGYIRACVVVEGSWDAICKQLYTSQAHPNSIIGSAMAIIIDYGIPIYFFNGREAARDFTGLFLMRYERWRERIDANTGGENGNDTTAGADASANGAHAGFDNNRGNRYPDLLF